MAEKHTHCQRKRKHSYSEPPTLFQAAFDLCKIFGIEDKGIKSNNGLCADYKQLWLLAVMIKIVLVCYWLTTKIKGHINMPFDD